MEISKRENIIFSWFAWHFFQMPKFLFLVWGNYVSFGLDFFSIPLLLSTLLSPWKKYAWNYPRGFNITEYLNTFVSNVFSRLIGALVRLLLIIIGIPIQIFIIVAGAAVILLWILLPFIEIGLLYVLIRI